LQFKTLYNEEFVMASKHIKTIPHQSTPEHQKPQRELSANEKIITHNIQYYPHQEQQNMFSKSSKLKKDQYMKMLSNSLSPSNFELEKMNNKPLE
jgi:hypothetical protein